MHCLCTTAFDMHCLRTTAFEVSYFHMAPKKKKEAKTKDTHKKKKKATTLRMWMATISVLINFLKV